MRILHVSSERSWRGGESQIAYLIQENRDPAVENLVLTRKRSAFETFCKKNGIHYFQGSFRWPRILLTARWLAQHGKDFDLIHAHTAKAHLLTFLSFFFGLKTPVIVARRVEFAPGNSWLTRKRYEHPKVARIVCVADRIREVMLNYLNRNQEKCITIHSGIDLSKFNGTTGASVRAEFGLAEDVLLIGITSALASEKGHTTFLMVAREILSRRKDVHFLIIGTGEMERSIRRFASDLDLTQYVTFTGFRKDVAMILPQLNLFLITSDQEGLANSVLEAFASNVPVVGTSAGGIPEMITHGVTGLMANPGEVDLLTEYSLFMLDHPEEADKMCRKAYRRVFDFSKEQTAAKTYEMYREIVPSDGSLMNVSNRKGHQLT